MSERPQTAAEELANSVSHALALIAAGIAVPFLIAAAARNGNAVNVVGASIFAATMVLLYMSSMLYHALPHERAKRFFRKLDHGAIYLFIAGSYTPFAVGALGTPWGPPLIGAVWILALLGVGLKATDRASHPILSTGLYVGMGWITAIAAGPLFEQIARPGLMLLAAGGLAYMLGVVFFLLDSRVRYGHLVWHLFVIVGTACHFFAVLHYAA
jgi:hemolysin III